MANKRFVFYGFLIALILAAPFLFPDFKTQLATLWLMIIVAITWDMTGGQMGYNSLGNIFFYGTGMYVAAIITIAIAFDVGEFTNAFSDKIYKFSDTEYFLGAVLGIIGAGIFCAISAVIIGYITFGLRGPYFAIGTLGVAIAAGELVSNWEWVGGGQGISLPVFPYDLELGKVIFYFLFAATGVIAFMFAKWLYGTRFGAAINAIRDDEEKAEAMGIHTMRYKLTTWSLSAFFVGVAGGISGIPADSLRATGNCLPNHQSWHIHGRMRTARRQGNSVGPRHRSDNISSVQRSDLELFTWLAVGRTRRADRGHCCLF